MARKAKGPASGALFGRETFAGVVVRTWTLAPERHMADVRLDNGRVYAAAAARVLSIGQAVRISLAGVRAEVVE